MFDCKIDSIKNMCLTDLNNPDFTIELGDDVANTTTAFPTETHQQNVRSLNHNKEVTFSAEILDPQTILTCTTDLKGKLLYLEFYTYMLFQARWHKKHRINKKWLKRYGTKREAVLVRADADYIGATCDEAHSEAAYEQGFEAVLGDMHYYLRPDQRRRILKSNLMEGIDVRRKRKDNK